MTVIKMDVVEEIRKFVEGECKKPTSKYGYEPYNAHFVPVYNYAKSLAIKRNADVAVVELAAWLHDIGSIIHGRENHHATGAEIAEKKLREFGYPESKIELVKKCIFNHRGSTKFDKESKEEQIIADADVMSHFDSIGGIFRAAFSFENHNQVSANHAVRTKLINSYNKLSPSAKGVIKPKYEAAMLLFGGKS